MDHLVQLFKLFTLYEIDQFGDFSAQRGRKVTSKNPSLGFGAAQFEHQCLVRPSRLQMGSGDRLPVIAERVLDIQEGDLLL